MENSPNNTLWIKLIIITRFSIIVGIVLISLSIFYYLVIYLPEKDQTKTQVEKEKQSALEQKELSDKLLLSYCLEDAEKAYSDNWDEDCKGLGLKDSCRLSAHSADRWDELKQKSKDECFRKYPSN